MIEKIESDLLSSNVFVVSLGDYCVIIDAGAVVEEVEKVVKDKKVEAIFLTHGHYDHSARVFSYAKKFGSKIYASKYIKEYLENGEYNYSEGKFSINDFSNFEFLKGNGTVEFPHFNVQYFQLGGHTKSDMIYKINDDIFVGDVLIGRDMGRIDLYGGSKEKMRESLQFLKDLDYKIMHSGHGLDNDKKAQDKVTSLWVKFLSR